MMYRLLLVDADDSHRNTLSDRLKDDGFAVSAAVGVRSALDAANRGWPHLALVDLRYADGNAEELATRLTRRGEVPFVVLSPLADGPTKIRALERFADDYVARPYLYDELVARVRRVLRRTLLQAEYDGELIDLGQDAQLDLLRREIHRPGSVTRLSPTESRLLEFFVRNAERVLPTDLVLQRVWLDGLADSHTLWEYVRRLRRKLGDRDPSPGRITSIRGLGYQFCRVTRRGGEGS
jgi:two-component system response regulator RegX3